MGNPWGRKPASLFSSSGAFPFVPIASYRDTPLRGDPWAIQTLQLRSFNFVLFLPFVVLSLSASRRRRPVSKIVCVYLRGSAANSFFSPIRNRKSPHASILIAMKTILQSAWSNEIFITFYTWNLQTNSVIVRTICQRRQFSVTAWSSTAKLTRVENSGFCNRYSLDTSLKVNPDVAYPNR